MSSLPIGASTPSDRAPHAPSGGGNPGPPSQRADGRTTFAADGTERGSTPGAAASGEVGAQGAREQQREGSGTSSACGPSSAGNRSAARRSEGGGARAASSPRPVRRGSA